VGGAIGCSLCSRGWLFGWGLGVGSASGGCQERILVIIVFFLVRNDDEATRIGTKRKTGGAR